MHSVHYSPSNRSHRISEKIGALALVEVTKDVFREFIRKHPALIFPAFEIQRLMQRKCLNLRFWRKISKRRIEISEDRYLSVSEIVELMNDRDMEQRALQEKCGSVAPEKYLKGKKNRRRGSEHTSATLDLSASDESACSANLAPPVHAYKEIPAIESKRRDSKVYVADSQTPHPRQATLEVLSTSVGTHSKRRVSAPTIDPSQNRQGEGFAQSAAVVGIAGELTAYSGRRTSLSLYVLSCREVGKGIQRTPSHLSSRPERRRAAHRVHGLQRHA